MAWFFQVNLLSAYFLSFLLVCILYTHMVLDHSFLHFQLCCTPLHLLWLHWCCLKTENIFFIKNQSLLFIEAGNTNMIVITILFNCQTTLFLCFDNFLPFFFSSNYQKRCASLLSTSLLYWIHPLFIIAYLFDIYLFYYFIFLFFFFQWTDCPKKEVTMTS